MGRKAKLRKKLTNGYKFLRWTFTPAKPDSIYFLTFHKCASSLFSKRVLPNLTGLWHKHYGGEIYRGVKSKFEFSERGYAYGPFRIAANNSPAFKGVQNLISNPKFLEDKIVICLVRDPRDILVSLYYSFGFSHGYSKVDAISKGQKSRREAIQRLTVDEYVIETAKEIRENFEKMFELTQNCKRCVIIKYEEMISDFDLFKDKFTKYVSVKKEVLDQIYQQSRPKMKEDTSSHRRSGQIQGFRNKLQPETITTINAQLADVLAKFNYEL